MPDSTHLTFIQHAAQELALQRAKSRLSRLARYNAGLSSLSIRHKRLITYPGFTGEFDGRFHCLWLLPQGQAGVPTLVTKTIGKQVFSHLKSAASLGAGIGASHIGGTVNSLHQTYSNAKSYSGAAGKAKSLLGGGFAKSIVDAAQSGMDAANLSATKGTDQEFFFRATTGDILMCGHAMVVHQGVSEPTLYMRPIDNGALTGIMRSFSYYKAKNVAREQVGFMASSGQKFVLKSDSSIEGPTDGPHKIL